jgi:hypothetical protein
MKVRIAPQFLSVSAQWSIGRPTIIEKPTQDYRCSPKLSHTWKKKAQIEYLCSELREDHSIF